MHTHKIKYLMMTAALSACVVSHAFAATPKTESTIMHDQITLGDVFDGVKSNADYFLAPAPAMGRSVTLNVHDLERISEAFHLGWTPAGELEHVVIRRASTEIDRFDVQAALQQKLTEKMKGQKFEMELSDRTVSFRVAENADKTVEVENLTTDAVKGEFKATVAAAGSKKEIRGKFYPISSLPVLKAPLRPGDVIADSDIDYVDMRAADITSSMVVDARKLVGQTPRHGVAALKPIVAGDLQLPTVIKKGDLVTMILKSNIISLTAQGRALDNGAEGDAVRVMNISSKQVIEGTVTGPQAVSIRPPSNSLSMNTL